MANANSSKSGNGAARKAAGKTTKAKRASNAEAKLRELRAIVADIAAGPPAPTAEQQHKWEQERLESTLTDIEEALDSLAQCRDTANAIETGHVSVEYLTPEVVGKYLRLALIEAGTTLETQLYNLGLLKPKRTSGRKPMDLPYFIGTYPKRHPIPFSNLPAPHPTDGKAETGKAVRT